MKKFLFSLLFSGVLLLTFIVLLGTGALHSWNPLDIVLIFVFLLLAPGIVAVYLLARWVFASFSKFIQQFSPAPSQPIIPEKQTISLDGDHEVIDEKGNPVP